MLKVVLVDDEPSVLEGLRIFVDWNSMGFEIAGESSDGEASLSLIRGVRPELVISDIRMPGLSGLELIEKINDDIDPAPKFLLLSGYNDFAYAQKAMQLGALGYLTKPLDAEELERELSRAAGIIENEKNATHENLELVHYIANQLYNDIMDGKQDEKLTRKAQFIFGIPVNAKIRIVQFIAGTDDEKNNAPESRIYDLFMRMAGMQNENCIFYNGSGSYIVIMHDGMQGFSSHTEFTEQLAGRLSGVDPGNYGSSAFWALVSGTAGGDVPENIRKCGKQLEQLQIYCMLHPENNVVYYEPLHESSVLCNQSESGTGTVFPELPFDRVVYAIKGSDAREIPKAIGEFFQQLDQSRNSRRLYSIYLYRLADVVRRMAYANGIEANRAILSFTASIGSMNPNCKKLALDMCNSVFDKLNINNDKSLVLMENEIIDHIKANFRKSLSLQSIAEKFSLPAIIISKIIRKKTGRKFNDYFNYLRIEYAKTLFASSDMKIAAVCEESGYSDYGYFTGKFKEITGVSPSEYKKKFT